ncbi:MAG: TauD/TfdA family dioxygenase, partial [Burkholderiaceae bacterium]|nr:TauD/TfdA family dioxygenase [Burkholderiaceae bacterium]
GGDTLFSNCYMAYEALSDTFKTMIKPLWAVHSMAYSLSQSMEWRKKDTAQRLTQINPPVEHPIVMVHPRSGREVLYVNEMMTNKIVGMSQDESNAILQMLFAHLVQPEFTYRHQWKPHDLVMWDNRCVMHKALMDRVPGTLRHMHRTTILGEARGRLHAPATA